MYSLILLAGLALPADPIIDRTQPLLSDWDISGTEVSVEITRGSGWYEYVYRFEAPPENIADVQDFLLQTSCPEPVADADIAALFPGRRGEEFRASVDNRPYMPVMHLWDDGSATAMVFPSGHASFYLLMAPGETDTLRVRSTGAPVPREFVLQPDVEYYERIDWPEDSDMIEGLPVERDFAVRGVIEGPGCQTLAQAQPEFRLAGTNDGVPEFAGVNSLLTYSLPTRNRMHVPDGKDVVEMLVHYGTALDPATFETCPAEARRYFHPAPGSVEHVRLPVSEARNFLTLAGRAKGAPPIQPRHDYATRLPIDVDVFEFRRHDLAYQPREIACQLYPRVPEELVRLAPPPPPRYDGQPLMTVLRWPVEGVENILMGKRYPLLLRLSELADPASLRMTLDGKELSGDGAGSEQSVIHTIMLPPQVGKHHVVISVAAKDEVIGAPREPMRLEKRYELRGMQMMLEARGVSVGPGGKVTQQPTVKITSEIDPETQEVIRTTRETSEEQ